MTAWLILVLSLDLLRFINAAHAFIATWGEVVHKSGVHGCEEDVCYEHLVTSMTFIAMEFTPPNGSFLIHQASEHNSVWIRSITSNQRSSWDAVVVLAAWQWVNSKLVWISHSCRE